MAGSRFMNTVAQQPLKSTTPVVGCDTIRLDYDVAPMGLAAAARYVLVEK